MDPYSRRSAWATLQEAKAEGRIILFSSHFLDEADLIGDRIIIMAHGAVRAAGTSPFLKKRYGVGYTLTLVKAANAEGRASADVAALTALVKQHVPESTLLSDVGAELAFQLPTASSPAFPALFRALEGGSSSTGAGAASPLGVESFGVSVTTLESVFLKISEEVAAEEAASASATAGKASKSYSLWQRIADAFGGTRSSGSATTIRAPLVDQHDPAQAARMGGFGAGGRDAWSLPESPFALFASHFDALFRKRLAWARRDAKALIFQLVIPVLALAMGLLLLQQTNTTSFPSLELTVAAQDYNTRVGGVTFTPYVATADGDALASYISAAGTASGNPVAPPATSAWVAVPPQELETAFPASTYAPTAQSCNNTCDYFVFASLPYDGLPICVLAPLLPGNVSAAGDWQLASWLAAHRDGSEPGGVGPSVERGATRYAAIRVDAAFPPLNDGPPPLGSAFVSYSVFGNSTGYHALPTYANLVHNGLLAWLRGDNSTASTIALTTAPLPYTSAQKSFIASITSFVAVLLTVIALAFIPSSFAVLLVKERETGAKHLQLLAGVSIPAYWASTAAWDFVNYMVPYAAFIGLIWGFGVGDLTSGASGAATALLLLLWGTASMGFAYVASFAFSSHSGAQTALLVANLLVAVLLIASFVMHQIDASSVCDVDAGLRFIYRLFPGYALGNGLLQLALLKQLPFIEDDCGRLSTFSTVTQTFSAFDMAVAGWPLTYLAIETVVYILLAVAIDTALSYPSVRAALMPDADVPAPPARDDDEDVAAEAARIDAGRATGDAIVVSHVRKVYGGRSAALTNRFGCRGRSAAPRAASYADGGAKIAVRDFSLGVPESEVFGFLGLNGAGKSTLMKILCGDVVPTSGNASLGGFDALREQPQVRRLLGYVPQHDALLELLTAREHLQLYARIKGVPAAQLDAVVENQLRVLGLAEYANKLAGTLSGGNKRKLSVAIALVGRPRILLADEPSTGMDPVSRRFMWGVLSAAAAEQGVSTIIVSHLMEEVVALCTRVGIMVGGRLRCLGSTAHLKHRHGDCWLLSAKLQPPAVKDVTSLTAQLQSAIAAGTLRAQAAGGSAGGTPKPGSALLTLSDVAVACKLLGEPVRAAQLTSVGSAWAIVSTAERDGGVSVASVAEWWAADTVAGALAVFLAERFPGAHLLERHGDYLRYELPRRAVTAAASTGTSMPLSELFSTFEAARAEGHLRIAEYALSEASLDDIFNSFAAKQDEEKGSVRGFA